MYIPQLDKDSLAFPDPRDANGEGIVAWGGDLNPSRLLRAYQNGIFPWYSHQDPILWWSTNPRLIMELNDFKFRKSLKKNLKNFEYKINKNFTQVMKNCAKIKRNKQNDTWINDDLIEAFTVLHGMGFAHSIESYQNGQLVGGLYGVSIGKIFCGESMFAYKTDASKAAYAILVKHLKKWGYDFIDCQVPTNHLKSLGAKEVSRNYYLKRLFKVNMETPQHEWKIDTSIVIT